MTTRHTTIAALTAILLTAGSSSIGFAQDSGAPQGMYSARGLIGADVYTAGDSDTAVGDVKNILFGNDMGIRSFVVQTKGRYGLGGRSYVVQPDELKVETVPGKKTSEPGYRVTLNQSTEDLARHPVYSDSWWNKSQKQAADAWQQTKQSAGSAWQTTKHSADSAWTSIRDKTSELVNGTQDSAESAGDGAGNTADRTGDTAKDKADSAQNAAGNAAHGAAGQADDAGQRGNP